MANPADRVTPANKWTLISVDPEVSLWLEGQFSPEDGVEYGRPANYAETSSTGADQPTVQYVNSGSAFVRMVTSFVSRHLADDIRPKLEALDALDRKDLTLGRPPRVSWSWGDLAISGKVEVVSKKISGWWPLSGFPRAVVFELRITEAEPLDFTGKGQQNGETQYVTLGSGELFESLGLRYYGDPLLGELIRRENPSIAAGEVPGDRVKVLEREHPRARAEVRPTSPGFLDRDRSGATWQPIVDALASSRGADPPGLPWALLPDVLAGTVVLELGED